MLSFNDFFQNHNLKNKATSHLNLYKVLKKVGLDSKKDIYLRDGPFSSGIGIVNLHHSRGTHWVCYINEICFGSFACVPPPKLSQFTIKQYGQCLYSEYNIQSLTRKKDSYCASCLYKIYLTKMLGIDFKSAVLILYYQKNS